MNSSISSPGSPGLPPGLRLRAGRFCQALSSATAAVERQIVTWLTALIFALILLNVVTRAIGRPLVWVDEAAIYTMVIACFIGTSLTVRQRLDFAMTLVVDKLNARQRSWANRAITLVGVLYAFFILWCCWRMFDPVGLWRAGFHLDQFSLATSNFMYSEPTQTLGIPKWYVYLVMPLYGLGLTIHSVANLLEDLGWVPRVGAEEALVVEAG